MAEENEDVVFDDVSTGEENIANEHIQESEDLYSDDGSHQQETEELDISPEEEQILADLNQIEALAAMSPEIRETDEYKNLQATLEKVRSEQQIAEGDEGDEGGEGDEYLEEDDDQESNVFGLGSSVDDDDIEFEIDESMADFITNHYGLNDVSGFFDTVDTWRNQAQKGSKAQGDLDEITEGLQSLPKEIKSAIDAFANGEDFFKAFNSTGGRLDFDVDFAKQDKEVIVKHYYAEQVEKLAQKMESGDLDDVEYDERIDMLYSSAERLFNSDQKMFSERRAEILQKEEDFYEDFKNSAISSVDTLKEQYPNFSGKELQKVRQRLVDGNIESLFVNKDGVYTEEAAKMVAFALYGESVMQSLIDRAERKGESNANEKLVRRGNEKPRASKTQRRQQSEAMDSISHLTGQFSDDPYSGSID
jgi:hypothetical protein